MFFCFIGFCVVRVRNGGDSVNVLFLMVIWFFCIIFSRVDWVFVGVWLILLVSSRLVNIGLWWILKFLVFGLYIVWLLMLLGIRFGVNCMCL